MKIAIVLFSHRGHTKKVGEVVAAQLIQAGHQIHRFELKPKEKLIFSAEVVEIEKPPDIRPYDAVILGSPVHGGRMSAPLRAFLNQIPIENNKPTILLLTHFFRKAWGAIQTIDTMQDICKSKGLKIIGYTTVKWLSLRRKHNIKLSANHITTLFAIN